jgi:hypothetical protein
MTRPDLLAQMRRNPAGDWTIADVERACRQAGVGCVPPTGGGSHYKVSHPSQAEILTIPARKPVKPIYIKKLAAFLARVGG